MELKEEASLLFHSYKGSPFADEALFYLGVANYNLNELDVANKYFSKYLKKRFSSTLFMDAVRYKFSIAEKFKTGAKKRMLKLKKAPKVLSGKDDAVIIYDEIIAILPNHELAVKSLFGKAEILISFKEYKESIETLQLLIKRFPKTDLAALAYLKIAEVFLKETSPKHQDFSLLDMAEINLRKFRDNFPSDERIREAEKMLLDMKEIYAQSLYEVGSFYERTKKTKASILYYTKVVSDFPETQYAGKSRERLGILSKKR